MSAHEIPADVRAKIGEIDLQAMSDEITHSEWWRDLCERNLRRKTEIANRTGLPWSEIR